MPEVHRRKNQKSKKKFHYPHGVCLKNAIGKRGWPQNSSEIATVAFSLQTPNSWVILLMCAPIVAVLFFYTMCISNWFVVVLFYGASFSLGHIPSVEVSRFTRTFTQKLS